MPDRINRHHGLVLRRFVGAPAAVQVTVWGYVSLAVCFTRRTLDPDRATWPCRVGHFLTTRGRADPSLSLTRGSFFWKKAVEVFQKQGLLIDRGNFFLGCANLAGLAGALPNLTPGVISMSRGFDGFDIDDFRDPQWESERYRPGRESGAAVHSLEAP